MYFILYISFLLKVTQVSPLAGIYWHYIFYWWTKGFKIFKDSLVLQDDWKLSCFLFVAFSHDIKELYFIDFISLVFTHLKIRFNL